MRHCHFFAAPTSAGSDVQSKDGKLDAFLHLILQAVSIGWLGFYPTKIAYFYHCVTHFYEVLGSRYVDIYRSKSCSVHCFSVNV